MNNELFGVPRQVSNLCPTACTSRYDRTTYGYLALLYISSPPRPAGTIRICRIFSFALTTPLYNGASFIILLKIRRHLPGSQFNYQNAMTERDNATNLSGAFILTTSAAEFPDEISVSEQIHHIGAVASLQVYSRRNCNSQRWRCLGFCERWCPRQDVRIKTKFLPEQDWSMRLCGRARSNRHI